VLTRIVRFRRRPGAVVSILLTVAAALAVPGVAGASPDTPPPTVASLTTQLDHLAQRAEALTEQYNATELAIRAQQRALVTAQARQVQAEAAYTVTRQRLVPLLVAQFESGSFGSTAAILTSRDPGAYLDTLATQNLVSRHWADVLKQVVTAQAQAERAAKKADNLLTRARQTQATLSDKRHEIRSQTAQYHTLLNALTSAQRDAYANRGAPTAAEITRALRTPAPSPGAEKAVQFAVAQIGKPYVWAASGPDAFDCSGLTLAAWATAGVHLPHFSLAQYGYGRHVSFDELEPGDLVFLYSDLHHVEMYVGGGLAISAPQEGEPVKFVHVADFRDVFSGATRLG
jgi:cell wall-associated NlpC family hydrolase